MLRDIRAILHLAWPTLIGQLAIIAFGVIDTAMVGRFSSADLAALGLGASIYISVYVALTGILVALSPIAGKLYGAGRYAEIGEEVRQSVWLAVVLALLGMALLIYPGALLHIAKASPALAQRATAYLRILALGLPASLIFRVYNSVATAIGRPRPVMVIEVAALAIKFPANYCLVFGVFGFAPLGGPGCAIASTVINWLAATAGIVSMLRDAPYRPLRIAAQFSWPRWSHQVALLKLGLPMGFSYLIEVTSYTFMALFIARFGTATLAAHQIAGNVGAVLYMTPLSIGIATGTLVAQALGSSDKDRAQRLSRHGVMLASVLGVGYATLLLIGRQQVASIYTTDPVVTATAADLLAVVACYHLFDALQISTAFVLRSYQLTVVPTVIYALALWGVGLGGGYCLGFDIPGTLPTYLVGAKGFWIANTVSLAATAAGLVLYCRHVVRRR